MHKRIILFLGLTYILCGCGHSSSDLSPSVTTSEDNTSVSAIPAPTVAVTLPQNPTSALIDLEKETSIEHMVTVDGYSSDFSATYESQHNEAAAESSLEASAIFEECYEVMYLTNNANIRFEPSINSSVYKIYSAGNAVLVIGRSDEWCMIDVNGQHLYVSTSLLTSTPPVGETTSDGADETTPVPSSTAPKPGNPIFIPL